MFYLFILDLPIFYSFSNCTDDKNVLEAIEEREDNYDTIASQRFITGTRNLTKVTRLELRKQGEERRQRDLQYSCPPKIYSDLSTIKKQLNRYKKCTLEKSQWRIQIIDALNKKTSSHFFADHQSWTQIARSTKDKVHKNTFRKIAREAKRDQATCCMQYHTFKEKKKKYGCKFHTLNLGHRCMSHQHSLF